MKATIKDKEGWIDFENKENQKLEARVKELEACLWGLSHDRARFIIRASESWTGVQANQVPTSSSNKEKAE